MTPRTPLSLTTHQLRPAAPAASARAGGGAASEVLRQGLPAHPHDLALRATSLTGSWSAASDLHPLERAMPTT